MVAVSVLIDGRRYDFSAMGNKRLGRPKLPRANAHTERVVVLLRPADLRALRRIARKRGVRLAVAGREIIEAALRRRK
jgi:hypothetical protein